VKHKETCHHPELAPTQWNQPKPEPYTGDTCDCGVNYHGPCACGLNVSQGLCQSPKGSARANRRLEWLRSVP
jgi:hypothetical protein